jgi:N-acetyl-alpha-D-muramate 1-phosphate uridylyltransferase
MTTMPTHGMVLAAGLGLRMRPLTEKTPKPLIPVAGRCMLDRALDHLAAMGVMSRVVNAHYLAQQIADHMDARQRDEGPTVNIAVSQEADLLDTGGGVVKALPLLGSAPFFVINGDIIWRDGPEPALRRLAASWNDSAMDALLLVHPRETAIGYDGPGDFNLAADGRLARRSGASAPFVFTGVQILSPRLLDGAPSGAFSLNQLYDRAAAAGRLHGLVHTGHWFHIGTPDGLRLAEERLRALA